jgi:hypothetical protein
LQNEETINYILGTFLVYFNYFIKVNKILIFRSLIAMGAA